MQKGILANVSDANKNDNNKNMKETHFKRPNEMHQKK